MQHVPTSGSNPTDHPYRGFPKVRNTFVRAPIIRSIIYESKIGAPLFMENYCMTQSGASMFGIKNCGLD